MANELSINFKLAFSKSGQSLQIPSFVENIDVSSSARNAAVQNIGTTHEALALGDLTTSNTGATKITNLDPTNYVEIGIVVSATFYPVFVLPAGKFMWAPRVSTNALYAKANTAAVNLEYYLFGQ